MIDTDYKDLSRIRCANVSIAKLLRSSVKLVRIPDTISLTIRISGRQWHCALAMFPPRKCRKEIHDHSRAKQTLTWRMQFNSRPIKVDRDRRRKLDYSASTLSFEGLCSKIYSSEFNDHLIGKSEQGSSRECFVLIGRLTLVYLCRFFERNLLDRLEGRRKRPKSPEKYRVCAILKYFAGANLFISVLRCIEGVQWVSPVCAFGKSVKMWVVLSLIWSHGKFCVPYLSYFVECISHRVFFCDIFGKVYKNVSRGTQMPAPDRAGKCISSYLSYFARVRCAFLVDFLRNLWEMHRKRARRPLSIAREIVSAIFKLKSAAYFSCFQLICQTMYREVTVSWLSDRDSLTISPNKRYLLCNISTF